MNPTKITRTTALFLPDSRRVIAKPFLPGEQTFPDVRSRVELVVKRILAMSEDEMASTLAVTHEQFDDRHKDLNRILEASFDVVADKIDNADEISPIHRLLIGAYFTHEYSIEAAALTNPSLVPAPDQSGLNPGEKRFVMSLRGIGEGHISSIEFRSGVIDANARITMDEPSLYATTGSRHHPIYDKHAFTTKLAELGALNEFADLCLNALPERFTFEQLEAAITDVSRLDKPLLLTVQTTRTIHWLASSNYRSTFTKESDISERVIFPGGPTESHGMEDARFVRFTHDDGSVVYYATYTAFDGFKILPQLIETPDFVSFRISTCNGQYAHSKGMALFPKMIGGRYAALSRHDNENNYLMLSDEVRFWNDSEIIQVPVHPWELMQVGNCGSPLETEAGWLVITHGVGPMRQYSLGALLLDTDDPHLVIGHLKEPFLIPREKERDGYVPNVVYSCGSMIHNDQLVLPYGFSDTGTRVALISLDDLLTRLTEQ